MSAPDFGEEKRPAPDVSREELLALADRMERCANHFSAHIGTVELTVTVREIAQLAAALRKAAPVEQEPVTWRDAAIDLAHDYRLGRIKTADAMVDKLIALATAPSDAPGDAVRTPLDLSPVELNQIATEAFGEAAERAKAFRQCDAENVDEDFPTRLVDWVFLYVTEGGAWPDRASISEHLIALAKQRSPTQADAFCFKDGASLKSFRALASEGRK